MKSDIEKLHKLRLKLGSKAQEMNVIFDYIYENSDSINVNAMADLGLKISKKSMNNCSNLEKLIDNIEKTL